MSAGIGGAHFGRVMRQNGWPAGSAYTFRPSSLAAPRASTRGAAAAGFADVEPSASAWCYATPADRSWWGSLWAERLTESPFGDRAVEHGLATRRDLERLADAWLRWAASDDGWFLIPHGEVLCRVPG